MTMMCAFFASCSSAIEVGTDQSLIIKKKRCQFHSSFIHKYWNIETESAWSSNWFHSYTIDLSGMLLLYAVCWMKNEFVTKMMTKFDVHVLRHYIAFMRQKTIKFFWPVTWGIFTRVYFISAQKMLSILFFSLFFACSTIHAGGTHYVLWDEIVKFVIY